MIKNETRESAHLKSRVKDLSVVPNLVSFTGLFTAITPIAKLEKNPDTGFYDPILIRDTDSLIANFGDPRIDPEKYIDLYTIMQVIGNGTSCYVCKVDSGDTGIYEFALVNEENLIKDGEDKDNDIAEITKADGHKIEDVTDSETNKVDRIASITGLNNEYNIAKVYGFVPEVQDTAASAVLHTFSADNKLEATAVHNEDESYEEGNKLSVKLDVVTPSSEADDGQAATGSYSIGEGEQLQTIQCTSNQVGTDDNGTEVVIARSSIESTDPDPVTTYRVDVTVTKGSDSNHFYADLGTDAPTSVDFDGSLSFIYDSGEGDPVVPTPTFDLILTGTINYSDIPDDDESMKITLGGGREAHEAVTGTYHVYVYKDGEQVGQTTDPVATSSDANEALSNFVVLSGDLAATDGAVKLEGGTDHADSKEWELTPVDYSYSSKHEDDGTVTLNVTVTDKKKPPYVLIKSAELDPDYGREDITFTKDENDNNVYTSNELDRRYSIIKVSKVSSDSSEEPEKINPDDFTLTWKQSGGKYIATITFKDGKAPVVDESDSDNPDDEPISYTLHVDEAARRDMSIKAYSSMADALDIYCSLSQAKPFSLHLFYLNVAASSNGNVLATAKVKLESTTTNQSLINNINSALGTYARFELVDKDTAAASEKNDSRGKSIVYNLLNKYAPYKDPDPTSKNHVRNDLKDNGYDNPVALEPPMVESQPNFKVNLQNYIDAQMQYKDKKYVGCLMADLTAPVTHTLDNAEMVANSNGKGVLPLDSEERRALHYNLKQIACERKDSTVIISTPYTYDHNDDTPLTLDEVCNWVASQADYANLWEYGSGNTTDYSIQSFYLEIYYSWLNLQCTKIENGLAKSVKVKVAPANLVVNNVLTSWRERGVQYPVAGDQYGTLTDQATILQNPKTKLERDQLVQYRINPIWDTGTRGIQIYGNETLNAGYTDLNAAHIARTLVYIRSRVDEYTETLKFLINSQILWDTWKNYVTAYILEPLAAANALSSFRVTMGNDTTSRAEIANRMIKGNIELTFYQSAEIFDLSFIVYSSATTVEEANPL